MTAERARLAAEATDLRSYPQPPDELFPSIESYYTTVSAHSSTSLHTNNMQESSRKTNAVAPVDADSAVPGSHASSSPTEEVSNREAKKEKPVKIRTGNEDNEPLYTLNPLYYPDMPKLGEPGVPEPSNNAEEDGAKRQQQPRGSLAYIRRGSQAVAEASKNFTRRLSASVQNGMGAVGKGLGVTSNEADMNRWREAKRERARSISGGNLGKVDRDADALLNALKDAADIMGDIDEAGEENIDVQKANRDFLKDLAAFEPDAELEMGKEDQDEEAQFERLQDARKSAASANIEDFSQVQAMRACSDEGPTVFCATPTAKAESGTSFVLSREQFEAKFCKAAEGLSAAVKGSWIDDSRVADTDDGAASVYENELAKPPVISAAGLSESRFLSETKLTGKRRKQSSSKHSSQTGNNDVWEATALVADKIHKRQMLKDIKAASSRLLEKPVDDNDAKFHTSKNNPTYGYPEANWDTTSEEEVWPVFPQGDVPRKPLPEGANPDDYLYGKEAFVHYLRYRKFEGEALAEKLEMEKLAARAQLLEKKQRIEEALKLAKEHYCTPYGGRRQSLKEKLAKLKSKTNVSSQKPISADLNEAHVRLQLESLQTFTPWFIYAITVVQAIAIAVYCAVGSIATIGLIPKVARQENLMTWHGTVEVVHYDMPNIWIGPPAKKANNLGAMFAPCVREDKLVTLANTKYAAIKAEDLGCCEVLGRGAGTTTKSECNSLVGNVTVNYEWRNISCANRNAANVPGGRFVEHKFKPCCYGYKGQCELLSHEHCDFIEGNFYVTTHEHCSQTHCDYNMCTMFESQASGLHPDEVLKPHSHNQFWRLPLSLIYHHGIIHAVLIGTVQVFIGADIERLAGWLRIGLIYVLCGLGGLLVGSTARPYEPNVGAGGAVFGLVAVTLIELLQSWKLVNKPAWPLLKVFSMIGMFLFSGFLPQVNQFTQLSGFVFGLFSAVIFLPYVSFELWQARARIALLVGCSLVILVLFIIAFFMFYKTQPISAGPLKYFNCMTFIPMSCNEDLP